ncbi:hypothetical protein Q9L58_002054 [Maublancomyces gigas]|uniref:Uncharacterized protein n=1 Tax=Discina gigas TaxID=1032678 RepID=A0ABR3GSD0_9PEZI
MLRTTAQKLPLRTYFFKYPQRATFTMTSRNLAGEDNPVHRAADKVGEKMPSKPEDPSIISSGGAIGRQFNPDGNIGQIGEKIGGPFSKDGMIGSQFDAAKGGIAGTVEKAVDGPSQKKSGDSSADEKIPGMGGAKK